MIVIENVELVVSGPLHNNEPTAAEIISYVEQHPIRGVLPYLIPHEAPVGMRHKGPSELGCHFPGSTDSEDPEDRVAARMEEDLHPVAGCLGVDPHDSPLKNANFLCVPSTVTPEQLALAVALDLDKVVVAHGYPFFRSFPRFASVETTRDPVANPLSRPEHWHGKLSQIAAIGIVGLRRLFEAHGNDLTYFAKTLIPLIGKDALTLAQVEQLERIPSSGETFEKVELPLEVAETLGVGGRITRVESWNHMNNSAVRPSLGTTGEGVPRREYFGAIFVEIDPPIAMNESTLQFAQHGQL